MYTRAHTILTKYMEYFACHCNVKYLWNTPSKAFEIQPLIVKSFIIRDLTIIISGYLLRQDDIKALCIFFFRITLCHNILLPVSLKIQSMPRFLSNECVAFDSVKSYLYIFCIIIKVL